MFPGTGCVLDGSHMNSFDFTTAVIDLAVDAGFEIDREQYGADLEAYKNDGLDEDTLLSVLDALDWTYEDALDFLNNGLPNGLYYTVYDQSLFLEESLD
jgi:hypothetical protein